MAERPDYTPLATNTPNGFVLHLNRLKSLAEKIRNAAANDSELTLDKDEVKTLAATLRLLSRSGKDRR